MCRRMIPRKTEVGSMFSYPTSCGKLGSLKFKLGFRLFSCWPWVTPPPPNLSTLAIASQSDSPFRPGLWRLMSLVSRFGNREMLLGVLAPFFHRSRSSFRECGEASANVWRGGFGNALRFWIGGSAGRKAEEAAERRVKGMDSCRL